MPLPDDWNFATGAIIACNAGTAYHIIKRLRVAGGTSVAVFGLGPLGLLWAQALGAEVIGVDPISKSSLLRRTIWPLA